MKGDHIQASVPAPVASLPPRQPIPSVHFSMARSVHLSMAIDKSARNAAASSSPKARIPARLDRSIVSTSAVVQLPRRSQMTFGGCARTKLIWWKSESLETMAKS